MPAPRLTLREAVASGRLADFIAQEERRGVGPVDGAALDAALARIVTAPQAGDPDDNGDARPAD